MARTFDERPIIAPGLSADVGKPDRPPATPPEDEQDPVNEVDTRYWERCLADAERAEKDWRSRGREIIRIYRNDGYYTPAGKKSLSKDIVFNILFSNTEVMLPNIYSTPPKPVVRSRFVRRSEPAEPPMPPPLGDMGMGPPPPELPPTQLPSGGGEPALPPGPMVNGPAGPGIMAEGGAPPAGNVAPTMPLAGGPPMPGANMGASAEALPPDLSVRVTTEDTTPPPPPEAPPLEKPGPPTPTPLAMGGLQPAAPPPGMPVQKDIETAAAVMEATLEIVLDDNASHEAVKAAVKDLLLPGRGTVRVRWHPEMQDAAPGNEDPSRDPSLPPEQIKVWETVQDEYVYWEDILFDPVRQFADTQWVAFRHLFTEKQLLSEFSDSDRLRTLKQKNRMDDVLKWTEEAAAKSVVGGGGAMRTADKLGDVIKKAMVWEIWNRDRREVIWFIREVSGIVLRVDPDALGLTDFFPIPRPLLAVTTTDSMLPRPYYDLYKRLASDLDETSKRISNLTEKIKIRGGYNAANRDIAQLLLADDGKMIPVDGVDLINGGLQNHIWLVPILEWVNALKELYIARDQIKATIYEVMGISDIMRGNTNPYETATAQRIKGTMGTNRLDGQKMVCANFALDLLRMKAEIIAKNFDANTLMRMTGEEVTPPVEAILRSDFQRTCSIDIEIDSTVSIDEQIEQESNAKMLMAMQGILQGAQGLLMTGVLPPPMVMQFTLELIKMMIQPLRNSRGVVELLDDFQEQLAAAAMTPPPMMPPASGGPGAGPPGVQPPPVAGPPAGPTQMNGGGAPMPMGPMS